MVRAKYVQNMPVYCLSKLGALNSTYTICTKYACILSVSKLGAINGMYKICTKYDCILSVAKLGAINGERWLLSHLS